MCLVSMNIPLLIPLFGPVWLAKQGVIRFTSTVNCNTHSSIALMQLEHMVCAMLQGHTAAVTHVAINERSSQVISLAADKIIKVQLSASQHLTCLVSHDSSAILTCS